jgi:hypothetical protein
VRRYQPRWLVIFLVNLLLLWLLGLANHTLGRFSLWGFDHVSLHLYGGGLFVTYAALRLDPTHGLAATLLTALAYDAVEPVPFGTSLFLFGIVHATLLYSRQRLPREGDLFGIVVVLFANLFLFLALSVLLVGAGPRPGEAWLRLFVDLLASQLVLLVITPWFFALQDATLALTRSTADTSRRFSS